MVGYFDFSCPYSYAMSERLRGAENKLEWRLVGHAPGRPVPMSGEADQRELEEVRRAVPDIELRQPPGLPNSGFASRVFAGLAPARRVDFLHRVFRALWVDGRDISSRDVIKLLAEGDINPVTMRWQAEWEALRVGVPVLLREDGARCLGIVTIDDLQTFLRGEGQSFEGIY